MSLSQALSAAISGLRANQAALSLVSSNVSNAETPGYVRKTLNQEATGTGDMGLGVRITGVNRELDTYIQTQLRTEMSGASYASTRAAFLEKLQGVYGDPDSAGTLEASLNGLVTALQSLSTSPESSSARIAVVNAARTIAQQLNATTSGIQTLRGNAENGLSDAVNTANTAMTQIASINAKLQNTLITGSDVPGENDISPTGRHDEPVLAEGKVQFYGQPIFCVIAKTREEARRACRLAKVEYDELPFITYVSEADPKKPRLVTDPLTLKRGDAATAIAAAPRKMKGQMRVGGQDHFYLEGQIALAVPGEAEGASASDDKHPRLPTKPKRCLDSALKAAAVASGDKAVEVRAARLHRRHQPPPHLQGKGMALGGAIEVEGGDGAVAADIDGVGHRPCNPLRLRTLSDRVAGENIGDSDAHIYVRADAHAPSSQPERAG